MGAMIGFAACALVLCAPPAPQAPVARPAACRVDYEIEARVEDAGPRLLGRERVRFENRTSVPTNELWFHLYWNAFSNNRSTHLTESGGKLRGVAIDAGWGWQRVTKISAAGVDLLSGLSFERPDDGNVEDRTVFKVVLAQPVAAGAELEIDVEWEAQIPRVRRRTGHKGDFLFIAQWFPKLGVFEGERGWNCHQFHASTEFFSDYGTYDVTLDLPARYENKIGATGAIAEPAQRVGDRVRTHFLAPAEVDRARLDTTGREPLVHDFAWTADPEFLRFTRTFHFDAWRERFDVEVAYVQRVFGPDKNLRLRNVDVTVLIHPERQTQWERHYEATCAALFFYGLWFGEYPYGHVTVVDPAWGAGAAGGMEYPTLFTAGTSMGTIPQTHSPESVVVHECGHQFWYGLVGNNEFESGWLDEGFNSFSDSETLVRAFGRSLDVTRFAGFVHTGVAPTPGPASSGFGGLLAARRVTLPLVAWDYRPLRASGLVDWWRQQPRLSFVEHWTDPRWSDRARYLRDPERDPIDTPGWKHADQTSYSTNSYARPAVALRSLIGIVGRDKFLLGMRRYAEEWRYAHPTPQNFFDTFCAGAGVDVHWYFADVFRGTGTVDWSVRVEQAREARPKGLFQGEPTGGFTERTAEAQETPWVAQVMLVRSGELCLPLTYELRFDDGSRERGEWSRAEQQRSKWHEFELRGQRKLVSVVLDPDRLCYLDRDMSDNAWFDERDERPALRWSERVFSYWLHALHWQAGIGG
jgi:hypothetical protein